MKKIFLLSLFIISFSCHKENEKIVNDFNFNNFDEINYHDTLYIKSRFSECGEWGGHNEIIKIFFVKDRKTMLHFERNVVKNCEDRDEKGGIIQKLVLKKGYILSNSQKKELMNYINNLLKSKFLENEIGNSGNSFSVENSKGDFKISNYGNQDFNIHIYNNLLKSLNIPKVKNEKF